MRKTLFVSISLLFIAVLGHAQFPAAGARQGGAQMTGRFYGKIIDSLLNKGIDAASVQLIQNKYDSTSKKKKDVIIAGMLTSPNGDFSLENVPIFGQYKLKITAIGYEDIQMNVKFDIKMPDRNSIANQDFSALLSMADKDLGNIKLKVDAKVLGNVTVTSDKPMLQLGIDRKVFNVEKNIVSAGGTAVDIMKNIPSLSVDLDGNVTLRNSSPQIFVDGRPTTMQLDQIPADAIESVEMITNPSAKFDASGGTAGILNIVLKKNKKVGYNGGIRVNADSRGRVGGGADINIRQNKVNFFSSVNYFPRKSISTGTTERNTLIGNPSSSLLQSDKNTSTGRFAFARAGFDYFIDNRNTFSLSGSLGGGKFKPFNTSDLYTTYNTQPLTSSFGLRNSESVGNFNFKGLQGSIKHNFPKPGREWTADVNYNRRDNKNDNTIMTEYYPSKGAPLDSSYSQRQLGEGYGSNLVVQTDFVNPINDQTKIEMGLRGAYNDNNSINNIFQYDETTNSYVLSGLLSSDFKSRSTVLAGYVTYSKQLKNFGYQLGLRAESSTFNGKIPSKATSFDINFPLSFFPSVFLSEKLKNDQELQINYSRRINRPGFWQLFPFIDYSDTLNLSRGNPELNPEFTNSFELSYQKIFKNRDNFLASLYFKNTNGLITRNQIVEANPVTGKDQLVNTYINANSSYITGLEMTMKNKVTKWWDLVSNLNLFTSKINVNDPLIAPQKQFFSWFGKLNNTFKIVKKLSLQVSGEYQSKTILPPNGGGGRFGGPWGQSSSTSQGYIRSSYFVDAGLRFDFLKNNMASVSLNVNDIFRTRRSWVYSESPYFTQDVFRRRDPQILRLNLSWRFGKFDPNLFKRKNMRGERESMQNMNEGTGF
ncbi:MAG: TonB-dependent receptor [Terrimonas sp.]|nr:TonB-dependent receptor [Terrimonas sp.]